MSHARIEIIGSADDPRLTAVEPLFAAMHEEMAAQGMQLRLVSGGARSWLEGIASGLERFGRLSVAMDGSTVVGFAHAALKLAPEHLGGSRMGQVTHLYVVPSHRRAGTARALAASLHEWLAGREVTSIELQVVHRNDPGLAFWRALGYVDELLQLRKR